jgi:hypothetical protein
MAWKIGSYSASKGQLTKTLSLYLGLRAPRGPRAATRPFDIDYFDLRATFFAVADFLIAYAALYARRTSPFFATGDDFIVRTRTVIKKDYTPSLVLSIPTASAQEFEDRMSVLRPSQGQGLLGELPELANGMNQISQTVLAILESLANAVLHNPPF